MSTEKLKSAVGEMKGFCEKHKPAILFGMRVLQDKELHAQFMEALVKKEYETYKDKVLYEQALDYVSK